MPTQRTYQSQGSQFLREAGRAILADEPGLGKTNQALLAAHGRTLVISPAMLRNVWRDEIELWAPDIDSIEWTSYSGVCRRTADTKGRNTVVTPVPRSTMQGRYDVVVCDESHYLKNRGTNWTKAIGKIKTDNLYLLTGTPLPNWGHEIYTTLKMLYPGDRRFTNYWRWIDEWFRTWKPPWGGTQVQGLQRGVSWEEAAQEWGLPGRWLRREIDDVLPDLPPMTRQTIAVEMTASQRKAYEQLKTDYVATLEDSNEVIAWSDGAKHTKLLQLATGVSTLDPKADKRQQGSGKLQMVEELMRERTSPTILFCAFINTANALAELMRAHGRSCGLVHSKRSMAERLQDIEEFSHGKIDVLIGTVGTLSEGHTLTRADTCVFVERSPRPITNAQARRRIHRFGQDRPTLSIDLVTEGTVDEGLSQLLDAKEADQSLALTGFQLASML
jgi:SNF2 family DNA or RNA helicase